MTAADGAEDDADPAPADPAAVREHVMAAVDAIVQAAESSAAAELAREERDALVLRLHREDGLSQREIVRQVNRELADRGHDPAEMQEARAGLTRRTVQRILSGDEG